MSQTQSTRNEECSAKQGTLYVALELGWSKWQLAFTTQAGQKPRLRTIKGRDVKSLEEEIRGAKQRFSLSESSRVVSCYEAGRDGFWLHRHLESVGVESRVVDSSSIEVNRRARRAKTDRLDVIKLVSLLVRYDSGEKGVWSVVRVPSPKEEDGRQLGRELELLKGERTGHWNRIRGLLAAQGIELGSGCQGRFQEWLEEVKLWDGSPLPASLRARLERELERLECVEEQIRTLEQHRREQVAEAKSREEKHVGQLLLLRGIGMNSSWLFVKEFFAWRQFRNRRQVGALSGLAPTPYSSGDGLHHEQGIAKSGNERVRTMAIEIAWGWLRWQPRSELSKWFQERFGKGNSRSRRVGIVALARKLLVALWRYLETGVIPEGAQLKAK
jgi:transposase